MLRFPLHYLGLLCAGLWACGSARAQQAAPVRGDADAMNAPVAILPPAAPAETLIALAKAADINVLADFASVPAPATAPAMLENDAERPLHTVLRRWSDERDWSFSRRDQRTFLLWNRPDLLALARDVRAAQNTEAAQNADAVTPAVAAPVAPADEPLNVALTRFFATPAARNDPKNPADWRDVPVMELPPPLRERLLQSVIGSQRAGLGFAAAGAVLDDAFWATATLKLRAMSTPLAQGGAAPAAPFLFIAGQVPYGSGGASTLLSLGRYVPPAAQNPTP